MERVIGYVKFTFQTQDQPSMLQNEAKHESTSFLLGNQLLHLHTLTHAHIYLHTHTYTHTYLYTHIYLHTLTLTPASNLCTLR